MARVQTQYQGEGEKLQVVRSPMLQPAQARYDPNASGAFQLAKALGAIDTEGLARQVNNVAAAKAIEDRQAAETYANSMTVEELGKKVKDGSMLPSQSPAFIGALQHIHGENSQSTFERDTLSKIQSGELKFESPAEMDKYLTEGRNGALEGQSKYTVAGFDKGYAGFREKAINANTAAMNKAATEHGVQESSDNLGNVLLQVTDKNFKGDPAQALVNRYQLLRKTSLLRDDAAKEALSGLMATIASSGNTALAKSFLDKKLDNGVTVRAVLGNAHAATYVQHSEAQFDKVERQRVDVELRPFLDKADKGELDTKALEEWAVKNEKYVTTSTLHSITSANRAANDRLQRDLAKGQVLAAAEASEHAANQNVEVAIKSGNLAFLPQQKVMTPTGEMKDFNTKEAAQRILTEDVQRKNMSLGKATEYWATNNVENPEWQKEIQAGASNVASVGWNYDGKNIGQLNPQGQKAVETFMRVNTTHPGYAEKLVGSKKDYETLSNIQFLVEKGGMPNVSDAAALVNQVNRADISPSDYGSMAKTVHSAVDDVVNPHWYSGRVAWFDGLFGNTEVNLTSVASDIRKRSELLVMSGQVKDAATAVKMSVEYLSNPRVTTKINNTLYFNKDLPQLPDSDTPSKWMERFIKEVPEKAARDQQMKGDIRLEPNSSGGFTSWIGGQPLIDKNNRVMVFRKEDISSWADGALKGDLYAKQADANYKLWLDAERKKLGDQMKKLGQAGSNSVDITINSDLYSRKTYERLLKEGKITQGK